MEIGSINPLFSRISGATREMPPLAWQQTKIRCLQPKTSQALTRRYGIVMTDLGAVLQQLKTERAKLDKAIAALSGVVGGKWGTASARGGRRRLSVAGRRRIAAAQRARWEKFKAKAT
jgi:hypothetical protein